MTGRVLLALAVTFLTTTGTAKAIFIADGPGAPLDPDDRTFTRTLREGSDIPGFRLTRLPTPVQPGLVILVERDNHDTISDAILFFNRPLFSCDPVAGYALFLSDRDDFPISLSAATDFLEDHLPPRVFDFIEDHTVVLTEARAVNGEEDTLYTPGTRRHHNTYHFISDQDSDPPDPVPEPGALTALASGLLCLLGYGRRRGKGTGS